MHDDLPILIKSYVAHPDRFHWFASIELGRAENHRPSHIVLVASARGVIDGDLIGCHRFGGLEEIGFDLFCSVVRDQCIVQISIGRINDASVLSHIFLVRNFCEKSAESLESLSSLLVVGDGSGVFEHLVVFRDALSRVRIWRAGWDENADY